MPYLKIQTNISVSKKIRQKIMTEASALVAHELAKPESFVMVALEPDTAMMFAGTVEPIAFLELKAVGLPVKNTKKLSQILCLMIEERLRVSKERIYVKFIDVKHGMWGWKGDTF